VKHHSSATARTVVRNVLMATALAAVLTGGASSVFAFAHEHHVKRTDQKNARQFEASGHQRRILRDKLVASGSRPRSAATGLLESSGIASVYSDHNTASGEQMSSGAMTAAHRTLPFGTKVNVVNRSNGRSAVVRINDRGPFVHGRVIDLSPAAAQALKVDGLAPVSLIVESAAVDERSGKRPDEERGSHPQLITQSPLNAGGPAQPAE
jgi:rare lipoprotein A